MAAVCAAGPLPMMTTFSAMRLCTSVFSPRTVVPHRTGVDHGAHMSLASLDQLDRSHRRHDDVMTQLLDAARRLAAGRPHDTDVNVVRDAVAYFERAVTRHFLDEEGSVFPRLSTRRPELAEALASLSAEHPAQIALQNAVAEAAKHLGNDARPGAGKALLELAERLAEQHHQHVA